MKSTEEITNSEDIIDSRDVIARIEHLETELTDAHEGVGGEVSERPFDEWLKETAEDQEHTMQEAAQELLALRAFAEEAEGYASDWNYGEALIRDSYFEDYARQLAEDIGAIPDDAKWPCTCIDWEKAASELQQDYTAVDFDGVTYWTR